MEKLDDTRGHTAPSHARTMGYGVTRNLPLQRLTGGSGSCAGRSLMPRSPVRPEQPLETTQGAPLSTIKHEKTHRITHTDIYQISNLPNPKTPNEIDKILNQTDRTIQRTKSITYIHELQKAIHTLSPVLWSFEPISKRAVRKISSRILDYELISIQMISIPTLEAFQEPKSNPFLQQKMSDTSMNSDHNDQSQQGSTNIQWFERNERFPTQQPPDAWLNPGEQVQPENPSDETQNMTALPVTQNNQSTTTQQQFNTLWQQRREEVRRRRFMPSETPTEKQLDDTLIAEKNWFHDYIGNHEEEEIATYANLTQSQKEEIELKIIQDYGQTEASSVPNIVSVLPQSFLNQTAPRNEIIFIMTAPNEITPREIIAALKNLPKDLRTPIMGVNETIPPIRTIKRTVDRIELCQPFVTFQVKPSLRTDYTKKVIQIRDSEKHLFKTRFWKVPSNAYVIAVKTTRGHSRDHVNSSTIHNRFKHLRYVMEWFAETDEGILIIFLYHSEEQRNTDFGRIKEIDKWHPSSSKPHKSKWMLSFQSSMGKVFVHWKFQRPDSPTNLV